MNKTKNCSTCKESKTLSDFSKDKSKNDGLQYSCKSCNKIKDSNYSKTEFGLITRIYAQQKESSKQRNHFPPNYTKDELSVWMYKNNFKQLYDNWVKSGHQKDLRPSCDRLNDFLGYSFDNIQLITWRENKKKGDKDSFKGNSTKCKAVNQFTLDGILIKKFKQMPTLLEFLNTNDINATNKQRSRIGKAISRKGDTNKRVPEDDGMVKVYSDEYLSEPEVQMIIIKELTK